jgi:hypothetical protein
VIRVIFGHNHKQVIAIAVEIVGLQMVLIMVRPENAVLDTPNLIRHVRRSMKIFILFLFLLPLKDILQQLYVLDGHSQDFVFGQLLVRGMGRDQLSQFGKCSRYILLTPTLPGVGENFTHDLSTSAYFCCKRNWDVEVDFAGQQILPCM